MAISTLVDVILRGSDSVGYTLVDLSTGEMISEIFSDLQVAFDTALDCGAITIWREHLDNRGRPLGPPSILIKPKLQS